MTQHGDDNLKHSPNCSDQTTTTEQGYSVVIVRCAGCGCLSTTRNTPSTTPTKRSMK